MESQIAYPCVKVTLESREMSPFYPVLCRESEYFIFAVSMSPIELGINGSLKWSWKMSVECEERTSGQWFDQRTASAFPCLTPWITALRVISRATARVFELEIYSSAFLILICGGCCPAPPALPPWSPSTLLLFQQQNTGNKTNSHRHSISPLSYPKLSLLSTCVATKLHTQREERHHHSSASTHH